MSRDDIVCGRYGRPEPAAGDQARIDTMVAQLKADPDIDWMQCGDIVVMRQWESDIHYSIWVGRGRELDPLFGVDGREVLV
jgi:hypothetical protein